MYESNTPNPDVDPGRGMQETFDQDTKSDNLILAISWHRIFLDATELPTTNI